MEEHLSPDVLEGVRNRSLPAEQLLAGMRHLDRCAECRGHLARPETVGPALARIRRDLRTGIEDHLSYEQMEALLDGTGEETERESSHQHLNRCPRCQAEYQDLAPLARRRPDAPARIRWIYSSLAVAGIAAALFLVLIPRSRAPGPDSQPDLLNGVALPSLYQAAVKAALASERIEFPPLPAGLIPAAGVLRGGPSPADAGFSPIEPRGVIVWSDRPRFRWHPLSEGARYVVSVYDLDLQRVAQSEATLATEWSPIQPLPRGGTYQWQVSAELGGRRLVTPAPPAPEARFRILESETARELDDASRSYANAPLILAVLYARAGLRLEARRELDTLVKSYPHSEVARRLRQSAGE